MFLVWHVLCVDAKVAFIFGVCCLVRYVNVFEKHGLTPQHGVQPLSERSGG